MLLQALYRLYGRLEREPGYGIEPWGWSNQNIVFKVVIERDGTLHAIEDVRAGSGGRLRPRRLLVPGGSKKTGSGLNPSFLWDKTDYLLGFETDQARRDRALRAHQEFRRRHLEVEPEIDDPDYSAVCRFLERWNAGQAAAWPVLKEVGPGYGVFQIRGQERYVHESQRIRDWWSARPDFEAWWRKGATAERLRGQCIVTGRSGVPIARKHPPIKGVHGARPTGAAIVSFNEDAYESYGRTQSYNAPVSEEAAQRYASALNALLTGPYRDRHRLVVGGITLVFWTEAPSEVEDVFLQILGEGSAALERAQDEELRQRIEAFVRALARGGGLEEGVRMGEAQTGFWIAGLGGNAARVEVRLLARGTVQELLGYVRAHHDAIRLVRRLDRDPELPSARSLLGELAPPGQEVPAPLAASFLESVVTGKSYPDAVYRAALRRIAADRRLGYLRMALIKGWLVRNCKMEDLTVSLDTERPDPAYRLGRLFAALEKTQKDALGENLNATIRDRFYSTASATPASVFPRLLRSYQHHIAKLDGGRRVSRERLVQEILDPVDSLPAHLGLVEQGLFALGYYHQMAAFYRPASGPTTDSSEGE